jgi:hypothetical protein
MIYLVSMLAVLALAGGALGVIWTTLHDQADAVVAALAGRSLRANVNALPARHIRVTIRPSVRRPIAVQPLRAAA